MRGEGLRPAQTGGAVMVLLACVLAARTQAGDTTGAPAEAPRDTWQDPGGTPGPAAAERAAAGRTPPIRSDGQQQGN
jgi:hypothetical protein